jgi:eukaryotic-like serine/threonine-protein kinase
MNSRPTLGEPAIPLTAFVEIDAACDRFEREFREGAEPDLASYLEGVDAAGRGPLFRNLLNIDLEYRMHRGGRPDIRRYRERFPEWCEVIESAFRSLTELPSSGETPLLESQQDGANGGAVPWDGLGRGELDDLKSAGYEVRRLLGWGGMGLVYEAVQLSLNRPVALKLIRSGSFSSESELLRFKNEAEAVAQLDHPHIVPIYEIAQHRGRYFFSMKLVEGTGLDRHLGRFADDPRSAARLVATVAEAIHHAHQRGILHRDLKPANILLDEGGRPQVTDFGLAKRIDVDLDQTHSNALIGTPSYMAPEQATRGRGRASTATDVYGLGTILYALLAGRAPFVGTTLVETLDLVRTRDPEPPSRVNPRVPRDLEVICRKCLEKEPDRRYPSALALAEDLTRWLQGEPILARPSGALRRAMLWCRRNSALAATAALGLSTLVVGLATVTWKWREADRERARSEAVVQLLTHRFLARPDWELLDSTGREPTVRNLLDSTASTLGGWLDGQVDVEAQVRQVIGGAYLSLGQLGPAEEQLRRAIELDARANGPRGRTGLRATSLLATLLDRSGRVAEAEPILRRNLADCRGALGPDDPVSLDAEERLGSVLWHLGRLDEAEDTLRRSAADRSRVFKPDHPETLRSIYLLSRLLRERRKFDQAGQLAYQYAHDIRCARGSNHPDLIVALTNQGDVERDRVRPAEAEQFYRLAVDEARRILGPDHPTTRSAEENLDRFAGR